MGRSDDCFKSSGQWVSPVEVEGVLLRHPGVARAAVVEDFDSDQLPCACAFVVKQDVESDSGQLEQELRKLLRPNRCRDSNNRAGMCSLPSCPTRRRERFSGSSCDKSYAPVTQNNEEHSGNVRTESRLLWLWSG